MTNLLSHLGQLTDSSLIDTTSLLLISTITGFALFIRERLEWNRAAFESRINISLNVIFDGILRIRTVHENDVGSIVMSPYARRLLKSAARKTTLEDPFLHFANEREAWMVYNEIINTISGLYGAQIISAAMRTSAAEEKFLIAITWERDAAMPIQKLRVILVQESVLREVGRGHENVKPEMPVQSTRISTLAKMHERLAAGTWPEYQTVSLPRG